MRSALAPPPADGFLAAERWRDEAASKVHGASPHHLALLNFLARQALDTVALTNFLAPNPVALKQTLREGGLNLLVRGAMNCAADLQRLMRNERSGAAEAFKLGDTVALINGAVVARPRLAEVGPTTKSVCAEPVVIAPAWIMKYYILDLRPENSPIKHLVDSGFTVFCISWRNPTSADREVGFDDYLSEGPHAGAQRGARDRRDRAGASRRLLHRRHLGCDRRRRDGARQRRSPAIADADRRAGSAFPHRHDRIEDFSARSRRLGRGGGHAAGIPVARLVRLASCAFKCREVAPPPVGLASADLKPLAPAPESMRSSRLAAKPVL